MDEKRYEIGLTTRKAVLTVEHVESTFRNTDDFTKPLQDLITEFCWGAGWADENLERSRRSLLTLGILAALGRFSEFETHVRAALNNGVTKAELQAALIHIAIYCGMPAAVEAARSMQRVLKS